MTRESEGVCFVVGDVHGSLEEMKELLNVVQFRKGKDRLVFLGDLVDRGPDPVGVVRHVRELGAESVLGNHDDKVVRWRAHEARRKAGGKKNPMRTPPEPRKTQWEALSEEDLTWMASLPYTVDLPGDFVGVHAGFEPNMPRAEQRGDRVMYVRYVDAEGKMMQTKGPGDVPEGAYYWTMWPGSEWLAPKRVVYGHAVHDLAEPRVDRNSHGGLFYGVDTGVCFGGALTCLVLDGSAEPKVVSVKAKAKYADLPTGNSYEF